jgi:hypothetical protein
MPWLVIGPKVGSLHVRQVASNAVMSESDQSTYLLLLRCSSSSSGAQ